MKTRKLRSRCLPHEIEAEVESRRAEGGDLPNETEARDSVDEAVKNDELKNGSNEPIEALGAEPLADIPHDSESETEANTEVMTARFVPAPAPPSAFPGDPSKTPAYAGDQAAPPPVPPPMLPPM